MLRLRGRRTEIGEHRIYIRFVDEVGQELIGGEGTVHFGEPPAGVVDIEASAVLVFDIPLPRPGSYAFELKLDDGQQLRVGLTAAAVPPGAQGPPSERPLH
ncbi:MAG: hypothetical protein ABJC74_14145 [Gemmatimonadota bacterium]